MPKPQLQKTSIGSRRVTKPFAVASVEEFEAVANGISETIRDRHMPYGTIMDPIFASPDSDKIISYTRTGDSAIWTGHYLAAESFRYKVSKDPVALANVESALAGIRGLIDITGNDVLARVAVPADSPYAQDIQREEGGHGVFDGVLHGHSHFWIGNTTRDQYSGVLFGLGVALELVPAVRAEVSAMITRLVRYLLNHFWTVSMPGGRISTVFLQRPDQKLAFLQIARKANAKEFASTYTKHRLALAGLVVVPIAYEVLDNHHSYFKFNLDTINLYSLIHHESDASLFKKNYRKAYDVLRRTTDDHRNAHFNMIDHAIKGPDKKRDQQTVEYLTDWLKRPRRDPFVDLRNMQFAFLEDRARDVIEIVLRPTTDFLWQRSPFLMFGGGVGVVEGPGIDFILPYWMARHYGVL